MNGVADEGAKPNRLQNFCGNLQVKCGLHCPSAAEWAHVVPVQAESRPWELGWGNPSRRAVPKARKGRAQPAAKLALFSSTVRVWYRSVLHGCAYAGFAA